MPTSVFINLPVADLERSKDFYTAIGWTLNAAFTNDDGAAVTVSDAIHVMLLTHANYSRFTEKAVADTSATSAAIHALNVDAADDVDALVDRAVRAGAVEGAPQDHGFMRSRAFADPDGHEWEALWMDPIAASGDWAAVQEKYPNVAGA